jgi:hypothetical protein
MTDDEILKLWRQHYEVLGFAHALMEKMKQETQREPVAYMATNALGFKFFRSRRPDDVYNPVPLYDLREKP